MKITLPLPPGINRTYGVNRDAEFPMYKRKPVKDWEFTAGWELKSQLGQFDMFEGPVQVGIAWYYKYDRDIDAGLKVLLDLLEKQRVVENDRQVRKIMYINIFKDSQLPRVEVEIHKL